MPHEPLGRSRRGADVRCPVRDLMAGADDRERPDPALCRVSVLCPELDAGTAGERTERERVPGQLDPAGDAVHGDGVAEHAAGAHLPSPGASRSRRIAARIPIGSPPAASTRRAAAARRAVAVAISYVIPHSHGPGSVMDPAGGWQGKECRWGSVTGTASGAAVMAWSPCSVRLWARACSISASRLGWQPTR